MLWNIYGTSQFSLNFYIKHFKPIIRITAGTTVNQHHLANQVKELPEPGVSLYTIT